MQQQADSPIDKPLLELESMTAFNGAVPSGLQVHPNKQHLIYPVGCTIVVQDINSKKQEHLSGHSNNITCVAISKSGRYLASGQVTHPGYKADMIIWDFEKRCIHGRLTLHKVKVEAVAFSPNDKYVASLGGQDDGAVVIWNIEKCEAICGSPAQVKSAGMTYCVAFANNCDDTFVTGGSDTLRVWKLDLVNRKIKPENVNLGQKKRVIKCLEVTPDDSFMYCGTTTGDILAVNVSSCNLTSLSSPKDCCSLGVTALKLLKTGDILVGGGDGSVSMFKDHFNKMKKIKNKSASLKGGAVTSIALRGEGHQFFVGTEKANMYRFNHSDFSVSLLGTCHSSEIKDVVFPADSSALYVTCAFEDVCVWCPHVDQELLRITVTNKTCNAVAIQRDGRAIVTGWDDTCIRLFTPESGQPMLVIENCHLGGVTALALFSDNVHIVSGGKNGDVRVWEVVNTYSKQGKPLLQGNLRFKLNEHKASVTCIKIRQDNRQCVSSSIDGTCIIWDLEKQCRVQMIRLNCLFKNVIYHPLGHQVITTGTDRKISYFEAYDGSMIRSLDGSMTGAINSMDISEDGQFFVIGGDDKLVKVWRYDEGEVTHMGIGHSAPITQVRISPDRSYILSVSTDGAILRWKFPFA